MLLKKKNPLIKHFKEVYFKLLFVINRNTILIFVGVFTSGYYSVFRKITPNCYKGGEPSTTEEFKLIQQFTHLTGTV